MLAIICVWQMVLIKLLLNTYYLGSRTPFIKTSLRIENVIKNLIKNQDLGRDLIEILIEILNEDFFLIENLNENLNEVLPKILIFDEVLNEVLDFWWGSWWEFLILNEVLAQDLIEFLILEQSHRDSQWEKQNVFRKARYEECRLGVQQCHPGVA